MFVTYCLIQVIKESERRQALIDDPDPLPPAPPPNDAICPIGGATAPTVTATAAATAPAAAPPLADPSKEKAE